MSQATSKEKTSRMIDSILSELEQEAKTTLRVLERVPDDNLSWRPHEKSMSLGQLALHIARTPSGIARLIAVDSYELSPDAFTNMPEAANRAEIITTFQKGLEEASEILNKIDDAAATATWTLSRGGKQMMAVPRIGFIRSILLNHSYHHRGQLSVYLRLLNVPVPSIYGPSADENPFGG